jgi:hypothetical protein
MQAASILPRGARSGSGSNEIGSLIKITIDGSLNASGIELRGAGTTIAQLRSSMAEALN